MNRGKTKVESDILIELCKIYGISINDVLSDYTYTKSSKLNLIDNSHTGKDYELQRIIDCYKNMSGEGKKLLVKQAEFYLKEYPDTKTNERAI